MSRRLSRVEEACKEELSEILQREIKDPRVGFVTITDVKLTADLRHARVFVSVFGSEQEAEQSLNGLESARGYLRFQLGRHLRLKYLPEIEFVHEHVAEDALRLNELMNRVKNERDENETG
jgi:ribosome-binding factor A